MASRTVSLTRKIAALAAGFVALMTLVPTAALAQVGYPPGPQQPVVAHTLPLGSPTGTHTGSRTGSSTGFAFTGADILLWAFVGLALVAVGTLLVIVYRRRARVAF